MNDGDSPSAGYATSDADWRAASVRGDFDLAIRLADVAALGTVDPPSDAERDTVACLAAVRNDLRTKAWADVEAWAASNPTGIDALVPGGSFASAVEEARALARSGALVDVRSVDEAVSLLDEAEERSTTFPAERLAQRGTAHVLLGASDVAKVLLERAVEIDARHVRARVNLGNVLLENGDLDAAVACYRSALDVDDGDPHALHNLGVALRRQGKIGESVSALRKAQAAEQKRAARPRGRRGGLRGGLRGGRDASSTDGSGASRPTFMGVPRSWIVTGALLAAIWWFFVR